MQLEVAHETQFVFLLGGDTNEVVVSHLVSSLLFLTLHSHLFYITEDMLQFGGKQGGQTEKENLFRRIACLLCFFFFFL